MLAAGNKITDLIKRTIISANLQSCIIALNCFIRHQKSKGLVCLYT